jgi:hypothetical protein
MKKILFFLLLLFCIHVSIFAINGNGTFGSPYNGPLTSNMNWSGVVYVNNDVTVNGFTLTISAGATVVFLSPSANLIITGTGVLTAVGTKSSTIRFTADSDNSGTYGGPGETWGHISFQNMTTVNPETYPSIIDNCIIEFGKKNTTLFNIDSFGGGIHVAFTYLTISNSVIRNNSAGWGGGIFINSGFSPSIKNCLITGNIGQTTGGGLLFYQNTASTIESCVIANNTCNGWGGGGGVFMGDYAGDLRFYNCTIASNINSYNNGTNIRLYYSGATRPKFYNTIVWGGSNSIQIYGTNPTPTDFNYCAIEGYTSGFTSCINLNGVNSDPTGPNFIDPNNLNYDIKFISPCRDAGSATGAPLTDFLGNSRVGPYDIGAYEVQYNSWKTNAPSNTWFSDSNWTLGIPTSSQDVIIPQVPGSNPNYPTNNVKLNYSLGTGKMLIMGPGAEATITSLTNNGTIQLQSDATGIASLIMNSYTDNGNEDIQLYLEGNSTGTMWHYVSPPFTSMLATDIASSNSSVAKYEENLITNNMNNGWATYTSSLGTGRT